MALNCINLHQKGFGGPLDPRPGSMAINIFATTSLSIPIIKAIIRLK